MNMLIRSSFGAYVALFVGSLAFMYIQKQRIPIVEFATHTTLILLLGKAVSNLGSNHPGANHGTSSGLLIVLCCVASFAVGLIMGRESSAKGFGKFFLLTSEAGSSNSAATGLTEANNNGSSNQQAKTSAGLVERKFKLKAKTESNSNMAIAEPASMTTQTALTAEAFGQSAEQREREILTLTSISDSQYAESIEKANATLMSIIGLPGYPGSFPGYDSCPWALVRSGSTAHLWVSRSKTDGVLVRATCIVNAQVRTVLRWLVAEDQLTGIESLCFRKEVLKSMNDGNITLRRLSCRSGAITSSKRDFVVVTSTSKLEDGTVIAASRSEQVPQQITSSMRKSAVGGYIRGIVYGSGYVLKPLDGLGCELYYAAHLDMLGNPNGRVNIAKTEILAGTILSNMEKLRQGAAKLYEETDSTVRKSDGQSSSEGNISRSSDNGSSVNSPAPALSMSLPSPANCMGLSSTQILEVVAAAKKVMQKVRNLHQATSRAGSSQSPSATREDQRTGRAFSDDLTAAGAITADAISPRPTEQGRLAEWQAPAEIEDAKSRWETFYDQNGITVSEQLDSVRAVGTLCAASTIEASPQVVKTLLLEHQEIIDGLLTGKSVLNQIDPHTYVQWLAYRALWPVGARDFLLVTSEEPFNLANGEGFVIASTSIDDICEDVDEEEAHDAATPVASADTRGSHTLSEFTRSNLRLAGYVGVPSATNPGATDLTVFVDLDAYSYTPAWLVQVCAQYGLSEMMGRIRAATCGGRLPGNSSSNSQLDTFLAHVLTREARMKRFQNDELGSPTQRPITANLIAGISVETEMRIGHVAAPLSSPKPSASSTREQSWERTDSKSSTEEKHQAEEKVGVAAVTVNSPDHPALQHALHHASHSFSSKSRKEEDEEKLELEASQSHHVSSSPPSPAVATITPPSPEQQLVRFAQRVMRKYHGIPDGDPVWGSVGEACEGNIGKLPSFTSLEWQQKTSKNNITVDACLVPGSDWQAIRARLVCGGTREKIRDLLLDDNRVGEYDDMFDFYKFLKQIDDRGVIRRFCFKGIWPTAPRDFVVCTSWTELNDGSFLIVSRSASDEYCATQKGYVRGFIHVSGYLLQPLYDHRASSSLRDGKAECRITLVAHTELGGTLPSSVINMLSTAAPLKMLAAISDLVRR